MSVTIPAHSNTGAIPQYDSWYLESHTNQHSLQDGSDTVGYSLAITALTVVLWSLIIACYISKVIRKP